MRPSFRELKRNAREALFGNYSILIMAYLFVELISSVLTSIFSPSTQSITSVQNIVYLLADFIIVLLVMVLSAGLLKLIMNMIRHEEMHASMVFFALRSQADRFIISGFLLTLLAVIPYAIPVVYAIIALPIEGDVTMMQFGILLGLFLLATVLALFIMLPFSFVFQILLDDIYCGAIEAFHRSRDLMKGNCIRLFLLDLSFIGWVLLGLLSFGIGFLWIGPYYQTVQTYFYFSLTGELNYTQQEENDDYAYQE